MVCDISTNSYSHLETEIYKQFSFYNYSVPQQMFIDMGGRKKGGKGGIYETCKVWHVPYQKRSTFIQKVR